MLQKRFRVECVAGEDFESVSNGPLPNTCVILCDGANDADVKKTTAGSYARCQLLHIAVLLCFAAAQGPGAAHASKWQGFLRLAHDVIATRSRQYTTTLNYTTHPSLHILRSCAKILQQILHWVSNGPCSSRQPVC